MTDQTEQVAAEVESRRVGRASDVEEERIETAVRLARERDRIDGEFRTAIAEVIRHGREMNGQLRDATAALQGVTNAQLTREAQERGADKTTMRSGTTRRDRWLIAGILISGTTGFLGLLLSTAALVVVILSH